MGTLNRKAMLSAGLFEFPETESLRLRKSHERRSRLEMMLDVLQVLGGSEEGPTRIMYRANLSWSICRQMLDRLAAKELVKVVSEGGRSRYGITPRGAEVLRAYTMAANEIED